jgi:hypothetical protein
MPGQVQWVCSQLPAMRATPPPGNTPASHQFQAEPHGDARIFCGIVQDRLKARIEGLLDQLNARIATGPKGEKPATHPAGVTFEQIAIGPAAEAEDSIALSVVFPAQFGQP